MRNLSMETKHILIIDDDADIREATQLCLELTGHWDVWKASNGPEGIAIAQSKAPDVILLDMMMPGMDGLAILQRLQDNPKTQQIPIIILTAKAQSHEQEYFGQLKVLSVITKPYDPMTISDQIFSALA
ncbi:MAG: response regulator [Cyanobacteria bacterium P01_A01_bin.15]